VKDIRIIIDAVYAMIDKVSIVFVFLIIVKINQKIPGKQIPGSKVINKKY